MLLFVLFQLLSGWHIWRNRSGSGYISAGWFQWNNLCIRANRNWQNIHNGRLVVSGRCDWFVMQQCLLCVWSHWLSWKCCCICQDISSQQLCLPYFIGSQNADLHPVSSPLTLWEYRCVPISADSVSTFLVIYSSLWLGKNWKIKEINGL
jgi:hypothetical protein